MFKKLSFMQNMHFKGLSLLISIMLWIAVLGSRNVEMSKEIPIDIITPTDLIVTGDMPDKVMFRFSGPKAFLRGILDRKEEPIRVNLSNAVPGITTYRFFQDNIQVPIGVKVHSITPSAVVLKLEQVKRKEVPIRLVTEGLPQSGYVINKVGLINNTIKIKGSQGRLDMINVVTTVPLNLKTLKESGDRPIFIDVSALSGISIEGEQPLVHVEVTRNESNFKIKNIAIKVLTDKKYKIEPKEVTIIVKTMPDTVSLLSTSKVFGVIDMKNKPPGSYEQSVQVQLPDGVRLLKSSPEKIRVTLY